MWRPLEIVAAHVLFIALMDSNVYYYMYKKENGIKWNTETDRNGQRQTVPLLLLGRARRPS